MTAPTIDRPVYMVTQPAGRDRRRSRPTSIGAVVVAASLLFGAGWLLDSRQARAELDALRTVVSADLAQARADVDVARGDIAVCRADLAEARR